MRECRSKSPWVVIIITGKDTGRAAGGIMCRSTFRDMLRVMFPIMWCVSAGIIIRGIIIITGIMEVVDGTGVGMLGTVMEGMVDMGTGMAGDARFGEI